ncbi:hypothetical protein [Porcipelethomonas sp.]|uniref:hypothetical protein n=1 Tax=Porcipelethomonas sp. TaxID=2981675 RepID=UPI003EF4A302
MKQLINNHKQSDVSDELKQKKRVRNALLIKLSVMLVITIIVIFLFISVAWFTMNREVSGNGMEMAAQGDNYTLEMIGNSNGLYYDTYHSEVMDSDSVIWTMCPADGNGIEQNFGNYAATEDDGIYPGCSGYVSFNIIPNVESEISLNFAFELLGYNAESNDENGINMVPLDKTEDADVINYLNGHILLFENYDKDTKKYSNLIQTSEDMKRVMTKKFNGKDTKTQVDIYWVWPLTLSNLIKVDDATELLCSESDMTTMESFIVSNPQYFMRGITVDEDTPLTVDELKNNYALYGSKYDQADNIIGVRVRYLRLKMTIS